MAGLISLLVYQGILVLLTFYFVVSCVRTEGDLPFRDYWFANELLVLVPACWGMALSYASIGMIMRSPRAFLVGMICHLLFEMVALPLMLFLSLAASTSPHGWSVLFGALMWLPFVLLSGWGFFYLRSLRKRLLSYRAAETD